MNKLIYSLFASTLALSVDVAHAASVAQVFTGDMLGTNQRYFESVARGESFRKRFTEMAVLSFSVAGISFLIGYALKTFTGIEA